MRNGISDQISILIIVRVNSAITCPVELLPLFSLPICDFLKEKNYALTSSSAIDKGPVFIFEIHLLQGGEPCISQLVKALFVEGTEPVRLTKIFKTGNSII
jgi:hypothetical protein